jgi:hypothetical protein
MGIKRKPRLSARWQIRSIPHFNSMNRKSQVIKKGLCFEEREREEDQKS